MGRRSSATESEVRAYRPDDEAGVLDLLETALGDGPAGGRTPEFFRWKHLENPFGRSYLLVSESGGHIAGLRAFMRWRFRADGREVRAVRAVDTATHPEHQGRGIFSALTRLGIEEVTQDADMVFNTPNAKSLPGYLKMGWRSVGRIDVDLRPRRPLGAATALLGLGSNGAPRRARPEVRAEAAPSALADPGVAELLAAADAPRGCLVTDRSVPFLRWRYADAPGFDYRAVRESVGARLTGLALFRVRPRGPLWETTIADVIAPAGDLRTALRLLRRVVQAAAVDHVSCRAARGTAAARAARVAGFVRLGKGPTLVVNPLRAVRPDPTDAATWRAVGVGDLEVF